MLSPKTTVDAKTTNAAGVLGSPPNAPKTEMTYCSKAEVNLAEISFTKLKRFYNLIEHTLLNGVTRSCNGFK